WAARLPGQVGPPARSGDRRIGSSVTGSMRSTNEMASSPAVWRSRYTSPGSRVTTMVAAGARREVTVGPATARRPTWHRSRRPHARQGRPWGPGGGPVRRPRRTRGSASTGRPAGAPPSDRRLAHEPVAAGGRVGAPQVVHQAVAERTHGRVVPPVVALQRIVDEVVELALGSVVGGPREVGGAHPPVPHDGAEVDVGAGDVAVPLGEHAF